MNTPSIDFDTTKKSMLLSFAIDEGFNYPQSVSNVMMLDVNRDHTFCKYKSTARLRLAWSLIKCGITYEKGYFIIQDDIRFYRLSLEQAIEYLLNPYIVYWSK